MTFISDTTSGNLFTYLPRKPKMIALSSLTSLARRRSIQLARIGAASFSSSSSFASPKTKSGRSEYFQNTTY